MKGLAQVSLHELMYGLSFINGIDLVAERNLALSGYQGLFEKYHSREMAVNKLVLFFCLLSLSALPMTTNALTFKKGEVLGPDGKVYSGASPDQQEKLIEKAKNGGDMAGVYGNNVYIIADDKVVYVPTRDLAGKSKESVKNIITANVVKEVTELDIDTDTFVENLQENLGDVEQALSATIQETVSQVQGQVGELDVSGKLGTLVTAANDYYQSGLSEAELNEAVQAANNAVNALPGELQSVINEVIDAAVKAVEQASSDIDAALQTWDSLSDSAKQAIVDEANSSGALGCGAGYTCTMSDAESLADSLR